MADLDGYHFDENGNDTNTSTDTNIWPDTSSETAADSVSNTGSDTLSDTDPDSGSVTDSGTGSADTGSDSTSDSETCVASVTEQCAGGDVHSFNSCGQDEGVVTDCHDTNAICENTSEQTASCTCLGHWDNATDCTTCIAGFTNNDDHCAHAVRYVVGGNAGVSGTTWADALNDVQSGIGKCAEAVSGGSAAICEVWVKSGTYHIYYNNVANTVNLLPDVEVYGGFNAIETHRSERDFNTNETILDGNDVTRANAVYHVLVAESGGLIDGFTIQNASSGSEDGKGGGMWIHPSAAPTIRNCRFLNNTSWSKGGAIYADESSNATVDHCYFNGNTGSTGGGGAIFNTTGATTVITNSIFESNTTYEGGGGGILNNSTGAVQISSCTFRDNFGDQGGGGVQVVFGDAMITDCVFDNNRSTDSSGTAVHATAALDNAIAIERCTIENHSYSAPVSASTAKGGAVYLGNIDATITNTVFSNNLASGMEAYGGALYQTGGFLKIANCTFSGNEVTAADGAAYERGAAVYVSGLTASIWNTIIWGNVPIAYQHNYNSPGGGLNISFSDVYGIDTSYNNNLNADPLFADSATGNLRISAGSVCIDAADGANAPSTDRDNESRYDHPTVPNTGTGTPNYADIGAYEYR